MTTVRLSCKVEPTDPSVPLKFQLRLDDQTLFEIAHVDQPSTVEIHIPDDEGSHCLSFCMSGKTADHTKLDSSNNIVQDACIKISNITFDDIDIVALLPNLAVYHHDFNGSGEPVEHKFYEVMGCNGSVDLEFSTPIYLWLLEQM